MRLDGTAEGLPPIENARTSRKVQCERGHSLSLKQRPTFWVTVGEAYQVAMARQDWSCDALTVQTIVKKGSAKEVLLFFQIVWSLNLRDLVPETPPAETTYDPAQLAQMTMAMKNAGLAGVTEELQNPSKPNHSATACTTANY